MRLAQRWREAFSNYPRHGTGLGFGMQPYGGWYRLEVRTRSGRILAQYPGDPPMLERAVAMAARGRGRQVWLVNFHVNMGARFDASEERIWIKP